MRSRSLLILAAVTAVCVVAAGWSVYQREARLALSESAGPLYPDLVARVNDVAKVEVATPDGAFDIVRGEDGEWSVPQKGGYPVRYETVKQAVVGIASFTAKEPRTSLPERHGRLRLLEPRGGTGEGNGQGEGTLMRLLDGGGEELAALIVGKTKSIETDTRDGWYYVRKQDRDQSWLASGRIEVWEDPVRWLDGELMKVERKRVRSARTVPPKGEPLLVARAAPDDVDFVPQDLPENAKVKSESKPNALGSALGYISFEDVLAADEVDFSQAHKAVFKTFDGMTVTLQLVERDGKHWAKFDASYDSADRVVDSVPEEQREGLKSEEEVRNEVAHINDRFGAWAYALPKYKADDYRIGYDDVVGPADKGQS